MAIWIRSQDGTELVLAREITSWLDCCDSEYCVRANKIEMGFYDSEAEIIAVLDRLQARLDLTTPESVIRQGKVFQMPPSGFLKEA